MARELTRLEHQLRERIDLSAFARSRGYSELGSNLLAVGMRHPGTGDVIVLTTSATHPWQYRSADDHRDRGDVLDFVRTREGKAGATAIELLRAWESDRSEQLPPFDLHARMRRADAARAVGQRFLESKGILPATLDDPQFKRSWDAPLRCRTLDTWESLSDTELRAELGDRPAPRHLVIAADTVTALSHYQLHHPKDTKYVALAGRENPGQGRYLESCMQDLGYPGTVIVARASGEAGDRFADRVERLLERAALHREMLAIEHHAPTVGRTWNDQLRLTTVSRDRHQPGAALGR